MKVLIRGFAVALGCASGAAVTLVACSSSEPRDPLVEDSDAGRASIPPPSHESDAAVTADAARQKPPFDPNDEPVTCTTDPCAVELVAGAHHFCARMSDGSVRCWGDDTKGALGTGSSDPSDAGSSADGGPFVVPYVSGLTGVTQLASGGTTTCALVADGGVSCWGGNDVGQLGLGAETPVVDSAPHPTPSPVALEEKATRIDVGPASACAVLASGDVWCWGDNSRQQLARADGSFFGVPAKAGLDGLQVTRTAAGRWSAFAVTAQGDLQSWGSVGGAEGSIAGRVSSIPTDPYPLSLGIGPVTSIAASSTTILPPDVSTPVSRGIAHACAVVKGDLVCWGESLMGALGTGVREPSIEPRRALYTSETAWARQVVVGDEMSCVRLTDGKVECAGGNTHGELGRDPSEQFAVVFKPATSFEGHAVQVAAAAATVCALVQGGSVVCWGSNARGELGQGTTSDEPRSAPVAVPF